MSEQEFKIGDFAINRAGGVFEIKKITIETVEGVETKLLWFTDNNCLKAEYCKHVYALVRDKDVVIVDKQKKDESVKYEHEFGVGDLAVTDTGIVFEVAKITQEWVGEAKLDVLWDDASRNVKAVNCERVKTWARDKEVRLVDKPKIPKFDSSKCKKSLDDFIVVAMDENGKWYGYTVKTMTTQHGCDYTYLYSEEPSELWRETLTVLTKEEKKC